MNLKYVYIICTCVIFLLACNNKIKVSKAYTSYLDSIPRIQPNAYCYVKNFKINNKEMVVYYSQISKTFLTQTGDKKSIIYTKINNNISSFYFHTLDSIFLLYKDSLEIINRKGVVLKTLKFNSYIQDKEGMFNVGLAKIDFPNLLYHSVTNELIIPTLRCDINFWNLDFFKSYLFVKLDLQTSKLKLIRNLSYPEVYNTNSYADNFGYDYCLNKNNIIISFTSNPNLVIYNLQTEKQSIINLKEESPMYTFDTNYKEDFNIIFEYLKKIPAYTRVLYDESKNKFYRIIQIPTKNIEQKKHKSYLSNFDIIIKVYNDKFEETNSINIGDRCNGYGCTVNAKGLQLKNFKNSQLYEYFETFIFN